MQYISSLSVHRVAQILCALAVIVVQGALPVCAQQRPPQLDCEPKQPKWGDTLTVRLKPADKLSLTDRIVAVPNLTFSNGNHQGRLYPTVRKDSVVVCRIPVEKDVASLSVFFYAENRDLRSASQYGGEVKIARTDGVLARGAYIEDMWTDSSAADKELKSYPDNYALFAEQWKIWFYQKREQCGKLIEPALKQLLSVKSSSDEYWMAVAIGYIALGKEQESRAALKRLMEEHPNSYRILSALQTYGFIAKEQKLGDSLTRKDLREAELKMLAQYPSAPYGRKFLQLTAMQRDTTTPFAILEAIVKAWMKQESENPQPHYYYATLCNRRGVNTEQGIASIERVIEAFIIPAQCLHYLFTRQWQYAQVYRTAAELYAKQQRYGAALACIKTAAELDVAVSDESVAHHRLREGTLWQQTGNLTDAEAAYLLAYTKGSKPAADSLRSLYRVSHGSENGFEEYLKEQSARTKSMFKPAILFAAKGLDGQMYDLAALKGKVVVLNFWFVGCPPCKEEIPALNRLVKDYTGKDVAFVSLALDKEKELRDFTKTTRFDYAIIPEAQGISDKYGIEGFPTHYVLTKTK
jgi:thiol-disulfide isomerase/thioredoxin